MTGPADLRSSSSAKYISRLSFILLAMYSVLTGLPRAPVWRGGKGRGAGPVGAGVKEGCHVGPAAVPRCGENGARRSMPCTLPAVLLLSHFL